MKVIGYTKNIIIFRLDLDHWHHLLTPIIIWVGEKLDDWEERRWLACAFYSLNFYVWGTF
jgi:hypothetical protein